MAVLIAVVLRQPDLFQMRAIMALQILWSVPLASAVGSYGLGAGGLFESSVLDT